MWGSSDVAVLSTLFDSMWPTAPPAPPGECIALSEFPEPGQGGCFDVGFIESAHDFLSAYRPVFFPPTFSTRPASNSGRSMSIAPWRETPRAAQISVGAKLW